MENTVEATKEVLDYPLSDGDIQKALRTPTKILTYPDLEFVNHIDDIFDKEGRSILLYPTTSETNGHWVCMIKKGNHIEFFDPYGNKPDSQLKWISDKKRRGFGIHYPTLTRLFKESGYDVDYNHHKFQENGNDINTCGRHCLARLHFKDLTLDQYKDFIKKSGLSPDEFVGGFTYLKLNK